MGGAPASTKMSMSNGRGAMLILWAALCSASVALLWAFRMFLTFVRLWRAGRNFPVPGKTVPVLGHTFIGIKYDHPGIVKHLISIVQDCPVGVIWVTQFPIFYVCDPRDMERILTSPKCSHKSQAYYIVAEAMGKGLVALSGDDWRRHHKIIAPTFHSKVLESFVPVFNTQTDRFIEELRKHVGERDFNITPFSDRFFLSIVGETAYGITSDSYEDPRGAVVDHIYTVEECLLERVSSPWLYPGWAFRRSACGRRQARALQSAHAIRDAAIRERAAELDRLGGAQANENQGEKRRLAFVDHLLLAARSGEPISNEEIADEVDTITAAAYDTLSLTFSYVLYELAINPEVQEKILEELETMYDPSLASIEVTPDDINNMTYLEMVLKETLRLHPPSPVFARYAQEDIQLASCDLTIPAGAQIAITNVVSHRNPKYFSHPDKFNPEHFDPEKCKDRHPYAFLPFSAGVRACIGRKLALLELKATLAKVLWEMEFSPAPGYEPRDMWGISMKPSNGVHIQVNERKRRPRQR